MSACTSDLGQVRVAYRIGLIGRVTAVPRLLGINSLPVTAERLRFKDSKIGEADGKTLGNTNKRICLTFSKLQDVPACPYSQSALIIPAE